MQPARQHCSAGDDAADSKGLVAHAVGCPSDRVRPVCSVSGLEHSALFLCTGGGRQGRRLPGMSRQRTVPQSE